MSRVEGVVPDALLSCTNGVVTSRCSPSSGSLTYKALPYGCVNNAPVRSTWVSAMSERAILFNSYAFIPMFSGPKCYFICESFYSSRGGTGVRWTLRHNIITTRCPRIGNVFLTSTESNHSARRSCFHRSLEYQCRL